MQFPTTTEQKDSKPQQFQFKFNFNFGKQENNQQQNLKQEEKKEEEKKTPLTKEEQLKQLPSARESIYFRTEQIKYFAWMKQADGKGKYEKQDQLINIQIYKQETSDKVNNCIKIYYKNQKSEVDDLFVQDIYFSTLTKEQPKIEYIKGKGVIITGLNYLHQEFDKNGKSTGQYQMSTYYLKLSDEQMEQMKKICDDINEKKELKPIEVIETGKFLEKKEEEKKEE